MKAKAAAVMFASLLFSTTTNAQFLDMFTQKAADVLNNTVSKTIDKTINAVTTPGSFGIFTGSNSGSAGSQNPKVYSKFDFVPGQTVLYYDDFVNDSIGEAPKGWITNTSAEVVTIDGMNGKWLKMQSPSSHHFSRCKKQNWGNNFTIEYDLLIVQTSGSPRPIFLLINTNGNLVTDESILKSDQRKETINIDTILDAQEDRSRIILNSSGKKISDNMQASLRFSNAVPVHVSISVQGKRFRMWWNEKKLYDVQTVNQNDIPNQFGFNFGYGETAEFYISNIRIAKDVPDTRADFNSGKIVSNLLFYTGTADIKPESMGALLEVSKVMKDASEPVKIVGHTDSDGDEAKNMKLSQERAEAVKDILVKEYGVDKGKLTTEGRGETQPIADNATSEGKSQNRRVEFIFKSEADTYTPQKFASINGPTVSTSGAKASAAASTGSGVELKSKLVGISLPYAYFLKKGNNNYTFVATKNDGDDTDNAIKIGLNVVGDKLKADTYLFDEQYANNPMYGSKKFPTISGAVGKLHYGKTEKPYIKQFSPIIANGHMSKYYDKALYANLPPKSDKVKFVIEKIENGMASGYFTLGIIVDGLKPVTIGDAMTETFTTGFSGEMTGKFNNIPVN